MMQMKWNSFYANSCYECGNWGSGYSLHLCKGCRAVSFCGKDFAKDHPKHEEFCRVLTELRGESSSIFLLDQDGKNDQEAWTALKANLMLIVTLKLGRKLSKQEEEVLKYPRRCMSCLEIDPNKLADCNVCPSTSYCVKHVPNAAEHSERCKKLLECAASEIFFSPMLKRDLPPFNYDDKTPIKLPADMKQFLNNCGAPLLPFPHNVQNSANSEIFTRPLTLLYAIKRLDFIVNSRLIVHIVGANAMELEDPSTFEVIFHYWPILRDLELIFIGPDLPKTFSMAIQVCKQCQEDEKTILMKTEAVFYHDYIKNAEDSRRADLIIGFNVGIHECFDVESSKDTWTPSMKAIAHEKAPLVVTAYTLDEAQKDHERIVACSDKFLTVVQEKNPFASLRHYRDFETEGFYYQNQFLMIYKKPEEVGEEVEALKALKLTDEAMVYD